VDATSDDLTVTVLGAGGSYAGPGEACSGYLVRAGGTAVIVDLGPGTFANLQRHVDPSAVDAVVLTHEHPDHWLDLPVLRNAHRYVLGLRDLPVYGTAGNERIARTLIGELEPTLRWHTIDPASVVEVGSMTLRFVATDHPVETLAVRVDASGRSLLYSADTGSGWDAGPVGSGVDLLLCEATFAPEHEDRTAHLSARQAAGYARDLGAGRLVITHVAPVVDPGDQRRLAAAVFGGPVEVAAAGRTFAV
jgi:ribonuclease BN (tRNA processing enzyme)